MRSKISFDENGMSSDAVLDSKAIPAIELYKKMILDSKWRLHTSRRVLIRNHSNMGLYQRQDIAEFRESIVDLFYFVNDMILEKLSELEKRNKGVHKEYRDLYSKILRLERGVSYPVPVLLDLASFVNTWLFRINITNLLRVEADALDVLESQY